MSFLLIFFPDHHHNSSKTISTVNNIHSPSPSSSRLLITKAQTTISICIILLFLTLFLFTLSTFEPSSNFPRPNRRFLLTRNTPHPSPHFALQGMGTLFLKGTKTMHDLTIAHIPSDTTEEDLRLFTRLLHCSGVTSRSDTVLLFDSPSSTSRFTKLIEEENHSFLKLVDVHRSDITLTNSVRGFNVTKFMQKYSKKELSSQSIWGKTKKNDRGNYYNGTVLMHGSIVAFDVAELDPENSLSGFMDHVPLSLRRWACYPMLLGRVRRNFKHVMLVDVKTTLILGDPFTRVQNRSPESVLVFFKHSNKKINEINPSVLIGGGKGIRRLSSAMHTEIVRAAIHQSKKKNLVLESVVLSQLVGNVHITKDFEMIMTPSESLEVESRTRNLVALWLKNRDVIVKRGSYSNHRDIMAMIMRHICLFELDSFVYNYC